MIMQRYGSGHEGAPLLLPGFAIKWQQNQVPRQAHLCDLTHIEIGLVIPYGVDKNAEI